jgi:hypothetical protein
MQWDFTGFAQHNEQRRGDKGAKFRLVFSYLCRDMLSTHQRRDTGICQGIWFGLVWLGWVWSDWKYDELFQLSIFQFPLFTVSAR